jgi:hypothetical protein
VGCGDSDASTGSSEQVSDCKQMMRYAAHVVYFSAYTTRRSDTVGNVAVLCQADRAP